MEKPRVAGWPIFLFPFFIRSLNFAGSTHMDRTLFNLPNLMTSYRFPAGLAVLWLIVSLNPATYPNGHYPAWISVTVMILATLVFLTDFYDGRVARRYGIVTNAGKMLDPIADSLFFTLLLMGLSLSGRFHVWIGFTVVLLYREAAIQTIRRYAALHGVALMAGRAGKLKMAAQSIAMSIFGFAVMFNDLGWARISEPALIALAWFGAMVTAAGAVISLGAYLRQLPAMIAAQKPAAES
jgi:CDP-diacylglycerol--glycerol-3-phosphate 3-phosphatidyltransferase